jgi:hypothetical protein
MTNVWQISCSSEKFYDAGPQEVLIDALWVSLCFIYDLNKQNLANKVNSCFFGECSFLHKNNIVIAE